MAKVIPNEEISTPTMYKIDSKGVTRVWRAWSTLNDDGTAVENNESGIDGGVLSGIPITVLVGKNIGKKNETTPLQQANVKILSKLDKKIKEGYVEDLAEFTQQGVMSAHSWEVSKHRMSPIALGQPKLDGIRLCTSKDSDGNITLMSKSNTEFKSFLYDLPWANWLNINMRNSTKVDGEMYIHGVDLNDIASLVMSYKLNTNELRESCEEVEGGLQINLKSKEILDLVYIGNFQPERQYEPVEKDGTVSYKPTNRFHESHGAIEVGRNKGWIFPGVSLEDLEVYGTTDLEYWIFDVPEEGVLAEQRNYNLADLWDNDESKEHGIVALIAEEFHIDNIEEVNARYVEQGFEGTMVRLPSGEYAFGERSAALQKFKLFYDAEWDIVGVELDREGNPTLLFVSDAGIEFKCRPTGTRAWRTRLLSDSDIIIGKRATIRYQCLYPDTLCPQFGRVIAIRDYE